MSHHNRDRIACRFRALRLSACGALLALALTAPSAQAATPAATTGPAIHVGPTHAQLTATVDPEGEATKFWFEWGTTTAYDHKAPIPYIKEGQTQEQAEAEPIFQELIDAGSGTNPLHHLQAIGGLDPETTYHFRVVAENASDTTPGSDESFTTTAPPAPQACSNETLRETQHATFLPDCRAYEMVSSPAKNGTNIVPDSQRTRAAADGSAVGFISLGAFADAIGTGVATDYIAERSHLSEPGDNGWATHAITPPQSGATFEGIVAILEPRYDGEFTPDLGAGVFFAQSPLDSDPSTADVSNLYLRDDLRSAGPGTYTLLSRCPLCETNGTPLPTPLDENAASYGRPRLAGISPDAAHVIFESNQRLTVDTPVASNRVEVYEWEGGTVRLAGRIPGSGSECDDGGAPACVPSRYSIAAQGTGLGNSIYRPPHAISDGSDGHSRVFFTRPTKADGVTLEPGGTAGQLFMRRDGHATMQLNASERSSADTTAPARFFDASTDGERVFFMTPQALTDDAPADGRWKVYMYDASKPASAPDNLTFLSDDQEPGDGVGDADGMIGASDDGSYVYLIVRSQLVPDGPPLGSDPGIYVWHGGSMRFVGPSPTGSAEDELLTTGADFVTRPRTARVTPDGRHLLFSTTSGAGLLGYGPCISGPGVGCRELYLYNAEDGDLACVSCNPTGAPATTNATDVIRTLNGGTQTSWHQNRAISADGHYVFFSTPEALVPADTNGKKDAYEYDAAREEVHLLSSGTAETDSWFMDASADGSNAFIITNQQLVGWDNDASYDLYDVRTDGGFPEPLPQAAPCASAETCKSSVESTPSSAPVGSTLEGPGNPPVKRPPCPKGTIAKKVHGKTRCVKKHSRKHHRHHHKGARAERGGSR